MHQPGTDVVQLWWHDGTTKFGEVRQTNGEWTASVLFSPWRTPLTLQQIADAVTEAHGLQGPVAGDGR